MIFSILLLFRDKIKAKFTKFPILIIIAIAVIVPWFVVLYQVYGLSKLGEILNVIEGGDQNRALYSARFPQPIFYLIEMTWPYNDVHPISLPLYIIVFMFCPL